jgi:hypothetical protein
MGQPNTIIRTIGSVTPSCSNISAIKTMAANAAAKMPK